MTTTHFPALDSTASTHSKTAPLARALTLMTSTTPDRSVTIARAALGLVLFPHGAQHVLGWFGGYGFSGTLGWMTGTLGFPAPLAALGLLVELVGPPLLLVGFGGRVTAALVLAFMATAASTHVANGFFMNWFGKLAAGQEGFEYHLLALALAAVVLLKGMGALSLDRALFSRRAPDTTA